MQRRKLEELSLMDDFLFNAMLTHPETGEKFTNKILKLLFNREFKNLKVSAQKFYAGMNTNFRGARLDVCIEGDCVSIEGDEIPSVYDVEPDQNNRVKDISAFPKRSRFYHAIIDSRSLKSGEDFGKLKQVYAIFICNYDPFGYDRILYTIKNRCLEDLKDIQKMVDVVKQDGEVSLQYMKSFEHDQLMYAQGEAAGREDGLRAGRLAEMKNTEREKKRADIAQSRIKELEAELKKYREKTTV